MKSKEIERWWPLFRNNTWRLIKNTSGPRQREVAAQRSKLSLTRSTADLSNIPYPWRITPKFNSYPSKDQKNSYLLIWRNTWTIYLDLNGDWKILSNRWQCPSFTHSSGGRNWCICMTWEEVGLRPEKSRASLKSRCTRDLWQLNKAGSFWWEAMCRTITIIWRIVSCMKRRGIISRHEPRWSIRALLTESCSTPEGFMYSVLICLERVTSIVRDMMWLQTDGLWSRKWTWRVLGLLSACFRRISSLHLEVAVNSKMTCLPLILLKCTTWNWTPGKWRRMTAIALCGCLLILRLASRSRSEKC